MRGSLDYVIDLIERAERAAKRAGSTLKQSFIDDVAGSIKRLINYLPKEARERILKDSRDYKFLEGRVKDLAGAETIARELGQRVLNLEKAREQESGEAIRLYHQVRWYEELNTELKRKYEEQDKQVTLLQVEIRKLNEALGRASPTRIKRLQLTLQKKQRELKEEEAALMQARRNFELDKAGLRRGVSNYLINYVRAHPELNVGFVIDRPGRFAYQSPEIKARFGDLEGKHCTSFINLPLEEVRNVSLLLENIQEETQAYVFTRTQDKQVLIRIVPKVFDGYFKGKEERIRCATFIYFPKTESGNLPLLGVLGEPRYARDIH